jgi:type II secretory pathway pseudopilin PulG
MVGVSTARRPSTDSGFTVLEVLIAATCFAVIALAGAWAMTTAAAAVARTRDETVALAAASVRLEQLRGLEWGHGDAHAPAATADFETDLSQPVRVGGGPGLGAAWPSTLHANQPGYVDHLDRDGRWVGNGVTAPPTARFTRRWAVSSMTGAPDLRLLQVVVTTRLTTSPLRPGDAVWLVALKGRKAN